MTARLTLKVIAGSRTTAFAGRHGDGWKLRVAAQPVDGKANDAIIRFLAEVASCPRSAVRIVSGATASTKIVEFAGIDPPELVKAIESAGPPP